MNLCSNATNPDVHGYWQNFLNTGSSNAPYVREEILRSWERCAQMGVEPFNEDTHNLLTGDSLQRTLRKRERLISVAHPFMVDLYAIVKGTGFVVTLANEDGYLIEILSDDGAAELPMTRNFIIGASWREEDAGTNAIGTALEDKKPVQVSGAEHYCQKHHCLTCSAAPIFDPNDRLIGILDVSGACENAHIHTLGMVVAAAKAIIAQLRIKKKNHQLAVANKKLISFFNMVSDGVLILDQDDTVVELNPAAERIIGKSRSKLAGRRLNHLLSGSSPGMKKSMDWERSRNDIELVLDTSKGPCQCLASAEPIINEQETVTGGFITLRPIKAVQSLINRYSGYLASLQFSDIIGDSQEIQEAIQLAKLSALNSSHVLLLGESGTGKEIFAQSIHNQSGRSSSPFIPLNCGAIPRELVGSELFGYEDGAFTGARQGGKPGKFELAAGGTLFLDEIGDMPLEQQAVLLRVIQEKRMTRIGGAKVIPVDVRLICATHKDLLAEVHKGTFRQDLYYRLNVMSLTIPPLRDRAEDIPQLFLHFLDRLCQDRGYSLTVNHELMPYLFSYPWPGNVRELQNVVERAANLAINGVVGINQLPGEIVRRRETNQHSKTRAEQPANRQQRQWKRKESERHQLLQLLDCHEGNISRVARELGVSRKTIYNRMHRYSIQN